MSLRKWAGHTECKDKDIHVNSDKYLHVVVSLFMSLGDVIILQINYLKKS